MAETKATPADITNRVRLQRFPDGHILATLPDGEQRTYKSQRTATGAVDRWHTAQWRALGYSLNWENVPAFETIYAWEDTAQ